MSDNEEFWKKKRADTQENAAREQAWRELEHARQHHERSQQQTREHFDRVHRDLLTMYRQLEDRKRLEPDKILSKEELADVNNRTAVWVDKRSASIRNIQNFDPTKEIATGSMQSFDKQANEILDKGNLATSIAFLNQAARLAQSQYDAFNTRQDALAKHAEENRQSGNEDLATVFEARKEYEAAAYERDTAQSVLAKYENLYGSDSKNYRHQQADCVELSASADELFEKLNAVMRVEQDLTTQYLDKATAVDNEVAPSEYARKATVDDKPEVDPSDLDYGVPNFDGPEWDEARADEALAAMDRGEEISDHEQDDFEHLIDGHTTELGADEIAQIAEDAHLADVEPDEQADEIYVAPAVAERKIEEQVSLNTKSSQNPSQGFITQLDEAAKREVGARKAGNSEGVLAAQEEQMVIAVKYNEYMDVRDDFQGALSTLQDDGDALLKAKESDRELAKSDFKQSYRAADQIIDNLQSENKAWAQLMREDLYAEVLQLQQKEREQTPGREADSITPVVEEAKREKKEEQSASVNNEDDADAMTVKQQRSDNTDTDTDTEAAAAKRQAEQAEKERQKERETQH